MMTYRDHGTTAPAFERAVYNDDRTATLNSPDVPKWESGNAPPPPVGAKIHLGLQ